MGFPFDYKLGPDAVEVLLFGRKCVRRVEYSDVAGVERGYAWLNEHYTQIWPLFSNFVTIRRKTGLLKNFVINPDEPDAFVAKLRMVLRR
jgi:hypothetical protein